MSEALDTPFQFMPRGGTCGCTRRRSCERHRDAITPAQRATLGTADRTARKRAPLKAPLRGELYLDRCRQDRIAYRERVRARKWMRAHVEN